MAEAEEIVVDASVVVKWFTKEEHSEKALEIKTLYERGVINLVAPKLLIYEVVNALRYNPSFGVQELKKAVKALEDMQLVLYDFLGQLAASAVEYAYKHGLSVYDSVYVALSLDHGRRYVTADREVVRKTASPLIIDLQDWKSLPSHSFR